MKNWVHLLLDSRNRWKFHMWLSSSQDKSWRVKASQHLSARVSASLNESARVDKSQRESCRVRAGQHTMLITQDNENILPNAMLLPRGENIIMDNQRSFENDNSPLCRELSKCIKVVYEQGIRVVSLQLDSRLLKITDTIRLVKFLDFEYWGYEFLYRNEVKCKI